MDRDEILHLLRSTVSQELDSKFSPDSMADISAMATTLDSYLLPRLEAAIVESAPLVIPGVIRTETNELIINDHKFVIRAAQSNRKLHRVDVSLINAEKGPASLKKYRTITVPGPGRYKSALIVVPAAIAAYREWFCDMTLAVLHPGYLWLDDKSKAVIKTYETSLGAEVYSYLRRLVDNPDVLTGLWFTVARDGNVTYLIEANTANGAGDSLLIDADDIVEGPQRALAEFLSLRLPQDKSFSQQLARSVDEGECKDFDFSIRMGSETPLLIAAQKTVFGGYHVSIMLIAKRGDTFIDALFPTARKNEILPILKTAQPTLKTLFLDSRWKKWLRELPKLARGVPLADVAAILTEIVKHSQPGP